MQAVGGTSAALYVHRRPEPSPIRFATAHRPEEACGSAERFDRDLNLDRLQAVLRDRAECDIVTTDARTMDLEPVIAGRPLRAQGGEVMSCHLVRQGDLDACLAIRRAAVRGPYLPADLATARKVVAHLSQALKLWGKVSADQRRIDVLTEAMNAVAFAIIFVDVDGWIIGANRAAERMLRSGYCLINSRGRITCQDHRETAALLSAIEAALSPSRQPARITWVPVSQSDGEHPVVTNVLPLPQYEPALNSIRQCRVAALLTADPAASPGRIVSVFSTIYALTPSETRLLNAVVEGVGLKRAAAKLGIAVTTARTHLQEIFAKTGTSRQSQLIRLFFESSAALCINEPPGDRAQRATLDVPSTARGGCAESPVARSSRRLFG